RAAAGGAAVGGNVSQRASPDARASDSGGGRQEREWAATDSGLQTGLSRARRPRQQELDRNGRRGFDMARNHHVYLGVLAAAAVGALGVSDARAQSTNDIVRPVQL